MARKINASAIAILALGHAFVEGERGAAGGAPSKNSIWGVARVNKELVTFSGRINGKLRIKIETSSEDDLMQMFKAKKAGLGMSYSYADITKKAAKAVPDLMERLVADYNEAKADGKLATRKMAVPAAQKIREALRSMTKGSKMATA